MDLQLQIKRALIAFAVWAALGGIALSRAAAEVPAAATLAVPAPMPAATVFASRHADEHCELRLRIAVTPSLRVTLPCDRSCSPLRGLAEVLGMPVETKSGSCAQLRSV